MENRAIVIYFEVMSEICLFFLFKIKNYIALLLAVLLVAILLMIWRQLNKKNNVLSDIFLIIKSFDWIAMQKWKT
jgi:hypothetical protein